MKLSAKQQLVKEFVKELHEGQKRKYTDEPYWHHLVRVATILDTFKVTYYRPAFLIEIALLHDVLEDQKHRCNEMQMVDRLKVCGYDYFDGMFITRAVIELTDVYTPKRLPDANRAKRKYLEAQRLHEISSVAQTVKYADLMDNTRDIVENDPKFAVTYLKEKEMILEGMVHGDKTLLASCRQLLLNSKEKLNEKANSN